MEEAYNLKKTSTSILREINILKDYKNLVYFLAS